MHAHLDLSDPEKVHDVQFVFKARDSTSPTGGRRWDLVQVVPSGMGLGVTAERTFIAVRAYIKSREVLALAEGHRGTGGVKHARRLDPETMGFTQEEMELVRDPGSRSPHRRERCCEDADCRGIFSHIVEKTGCCTDPKRCPEDLCHEDDHVDGCLHEKKRKEREEREAAKKPR